MSYTNEELENYLQDAIEVEFLSFNTIYIIFPNQHEADGSYRALLSRFSESELIIQLKPISETRIEIYFTDKFSSDTVKTKELEMRPSALEDYIATHDSDEYVEVYFISIYYQPDGHGVANTSHVLWQQDDILPVFGYNIIRNNNS